MVRKSLLYMTIVKGSKGKFFKSVWWHFWILAVCDLDIFLLYGSFFSRSEQINHNSWDALSLVIYKIII